MKKVILSLLMLLPLAVPQADAERQLLDRVVAVVNNEAITQSELDMLLRPVYESYKQELQGQLLYKRLNEAREKLLNQLIEDRLVFQEAEDRGIKVNEAQVEEQLQEFKSRFGSEKELEEAMRIQGMTLSNVRERLRRQVMIKTLHDAEIRSKIIVSPTEVEDYFHSNPEEFNENEKIQLRSLTIRKSDSARSKGLKDEKAWDNIQNIREMVMVGEDFGKLAAKHSEDVHAEKEGLGDWIQRGEMIAAIDDIVFNLSVGELSEVIETPMGYHLFRVEDRQESTTLTLEQVREQVMAFLYSKKTEERFHSWMKDLRSKAYISLR